MKKLKLIALAALISAMSAAATWAQEKGLNTTRWYISSGPGAGEILYGPSHDLEDNDSTSQGHVGTGPECDCAHYHGTLRGKADPNPNGCGWGCIEALPSTLLEAQLFLDAAISANITNTALKDKIFDMLDVADTAISTDCNSLFDGVMDAIGAELAGALANGQFSDAQIDALLTAFIDYVSMGLEEMGLPFPEPPPPPKPCEVSLMLRRGSAGQTKLFDAKRKVNADVGEVVVLDAQGCPEGGDYEWEYKFMGAAKGDVPSRTGVSFTEQRFCVVAEKATSVTVTVIYHCPDGKIVKDTATISIQ